MSSASSTCTALSNFLSYLDSLTERPDLGDLEQHLLKLEISPEDIDVYSVFNKRTYARNLIYESDTVQLLCLCWSSGQRSPIHDHAQSICGVRIVKGTATETKFDRVPSGFIKAVASNDYSKDTVMVSQDADTHQISNLQGEGDDLITLHLYSPPLNRMKTYSIESREVTEYKPHNHVVLLDGGGI
jgi:cysteine dioxygenase